jgi:tetratricopeptide (TPR) repeat protein
MKVILYGWLCFLVCGLTSSCKKSWLEAKSDKSITVPTAIDDFKALMNNYVYFNYTPYLGELSSDDYYLLYNSWNTLQPTERNGHIWLSEVYEGAVPTDWTYPYTEIMYSNVVLEGVNKIIPDESNLTEWRNVKGSALFHRAFNFYNLAQVFCKTYSNSASTDLGIPLHLTSDINIVPSRGTVEQTYNQIIRDLNEAKDLLSNSVNPSFNSIPSKPAVYGLFARVYLVMQDYDKALLYADSCLQLKNDIINYNSNPPINTSAAFPIPRNNSETIFNAKVVTYPSYRSSRLIVDSVLYQSYDNNDLRKIAFFTNSTLGTGLRTYKGSYDGSFTLFTGIATDEIYLIRSECYARKNDISNAMNDLNSLLVKRWKTGTFTALTASSADDALSKILKERRKELIYRGVRWTDLRRLNDQGANITLKRVLNGQTYTLAANDSRYVLPIPDKEIQLSGVEQNPR